MAREALPPLVALIPVTFALLPRAMSPTIVAATLLEVPTAIALLASACVSLPASLQTSAQIQQKVQAYYQTHGQGS